MTHPSNTNAETHVVVGAGPLGQAAAAALRNDGHRVKLVNRSGTLVAPLQGIEIVAGNVLKPETTAQTFKGASAIYFCAQPAYHRWTEEFLPLQRAVIESAAAAGARLIVAENLYGYGPVDGPMTEDMPLKPNTRKGAVRAAMHQELMAAHQAGNVAVAVARASDFFGPHVEGSAVGARLFQAIVAGRKAEVFGDPETLHSYTFVDDFGVALAKLGADPHALGQVWHVPNAPAVSTRRFVEIACMLAERPFAMRAVGALELRMLGLFIKPVKEMIEMRYEFEAPFVVDDRKFAEKFGDISTPLEAALARTLQWTRDKNSVGRPAAT
jgi:nucleoside-diphosphate-sugar epimerase